MIHGIVIGVLTGAFTYLGALWLCERLFEREGVQKVVALAVSIPVAQFIIWDLK